MPKAVAATIQAFKLDQPVHDHDERAAPLQFIVVPCLARREDEHPAFERRWHALPQQGDWRSVGVHANQPQSVAGKPNAGNSSGTKAVISATWPRSIRSTSSTWAR